MNPDSNNPIPDEQNNSTNPVNNNDINENPNINTTQPANTTVLSNVKEKKNNGVMKIIAIIVICLFVLGGGAFAYKKVQDSKKPENIIPKAMKKNYLNKKMTGTISFKLKEKNYKEQSKILNNFFKTIDVTAVRDKKTKTAKISYFISNKKGKIGGINAITDKNFDNMYLNLDIKSKAVSNLIDTALDIYKTTSDQEMPEEVPVVLPGIKKEVSKIAKKLNKKWYKADIEEMVGGKNPVLTCLDQDSFEDFNKKIQYKLADDKDFTKSFKRIEDEYDGSVLVYKPNAKDLNKLNKKVIKLSKSTKFMKCIAKNTGADLDKLDDAVDKEKIDKDFKNNIEYKLYINDNNDLKKTIVVLKSKRMDINIVIKYEDHNEKISIPKNPSDIRDLENDVREMFTNSSIGKLIEKHRNN